LSRIHIISDITTIVVTSADAAGIAREVIGSIAPAMIRLTVKEVAEKEGIENANQLAAITGLPYETCRTIWNDTAVLIHKKTLGRLCSVLHVRPSQLIEWVPDDEDLPSARKSIRHKV
jgi:DNA-binding Xre family transcriptional regulator